MALKFLVDECLSLTLVDVAHERTFEAYHVVHRGLAGCPDHDLKRVLLEEDLVLVTNNASDFRTLLGKKDEIHHGLVIVVTQVRPSVQGILFAALLDYLKDRPDLVNRVIEVDLDDATKKAVSLNERVPDTEWKRIEASVKPVIREYDLPSVTE